MNLCQIASKRTLAIDHWDGTESLRHTFLTPSRGYSCLSPPRLLAPPPRLLLPLRDPRPRLVWNS